MRILIVFTMLASSVAAAAAPVPAPLWEPLASRGGRADLAPLARDARTAAPYAVRAALAPGVGPSGLAALGNWTAPLLFGGSEEIVVRLSVRSDQAVELTAYGLGDPEPATAPILPLGGAVQRVHLPCGPDVDGRLAIMSDTSCTLEVLGIAPLDHPTAHDRDYWTEALFLAQFSRRAEADCARLARLGVLPVGLDDALLRRRAALFTRPGPASLDALRTDLEKSRLRAALARSLLTLNDRCALLERRESLLTRLGALPPRGESQLENARDLLGEAQRALALDNAGACARRRDRCDAELTNGGRALGKASAGLRCGPIVRNGRFEWPTGEPFAPVPYEIPLAEASLGAERALAEAANMALLSAPAADLATDRPAVERRLRDLAESCEALALPFALRLLGPVGEGEPSLAPRLVSIVAGSPSYFACAVDGDPAGRALVDAIAEAAPGTAVVVVPAAPTASPACDLPFGMHGVASTPTALSLSPTNLAARLAAAPLAAGATTSGSRILDERAVLPASAAERRALAWGGRARPHRIAFIASASKVADSTSIAPPILDALGALNVDADLILDTAVAADPTLPARYKALICEAGHLSADAFGVLWRSGVPILYLSPLNTDEQAYQRALVDSGAFLARTGGVWKLDAAPARVTLGRPALVLDPLERAMDDGWFRLDAAPPAGPAVLSELARHANAPRRWWLFRLWVNEAQAQSGAVVHLPAGLSPGAEILVNGERLREPRPASPAPEAGFPAGVADIRPGLLVWDKENRIAIGVRGDALSDAPSLTLEFVPPLIPRAIEAYGHMGAGETAVCRVPEGAPLFRREALLPSVRVLMEDQTSKAPLLLRQGNSVLWNGLAPPDGPFMERLIASFLRAVAEDHVYPPNGVTRGLLVEDTASGVLIARKWPERTEIVLGGQRALLSQCGPEPEWQRIGGANVVALAPAPVGTLYALWRSELQVRPEGGETTLRDLRRDASLPGRLLFEFRTSGAGGRMALYPPFTGRVRCLALVDRAAVPTQREGSAYSFAFPAGDHAVRIEAYGPGE